MENNNQKSKNSNQNNKPEQQTETTRQSQVRFKPIPASELAKIQKSKDSEPLEKKKD